MKMVPEGYQWLIKLNPVFYIVEGYRNSLIYHTWFWEEIGMSIYFWVITCLIFGLGAITFRRLRPHFADVL